MDKFGATPGWKGVEVHRSRVRNLILRRSTPKDEFRTTVLGTSDVEYPVPSRRGLASCGGHRPPRRLRTSSSTRSTGRVKLEYSTRRAARRPTGGKKGEKGHAEQHRADAGLDTEGAGVDLRGVHAG